MTLTRIASIGAGNMARALIGGLRTAGFDPRNIVVSDPGAEQRTAVAADFGVSVAANNIDAVRGAQLVILAVKPQQMPAVLAELREVVAVERPLILSVAAGIRIETIARELGGYERVIRSMPNRPALLGCGITALFASPAVDAAGRAAAEQVMQSVGKAVWLEREEQMDAVTAVSGSGPAYFFLLIELLEEAARELGLPPQMARALSIETAYGAATMAREPSSQTNPYGDPARLRAEVTSRGGTTEAALAVLGDADLRGIVRRAVSAAARRSSELAGR